MGQRRRLTAEFQRQAVQLLNAGQRPAAEIARELGRFLGMACTNGRKRSRCRVSTAAHRTRYHAQYEPARDLLRQRGSRELLQHVEE